MLTPERDANAGLTEGLGSTVTGCWDVVSEVSASEAVGMGTEGPELSVMMMMAAAGRIGLPWQGYMRVVIELPSS